MFETHDIKRVSLINFLKVMFLSLVVGFVSSLFIAYTFAILLGVVGFLYHPLSLIIASSYFASHYVAVYLKLKKKEDINIYKIILFSLLVFLGLEFLRIVGSSGY